MTLLAHWPLSDGPGSTVLTAEDIAAGGSGAHDGTYYNHNLLAPGVSGYHLFINADYGTVRDIQNDSDLLILGDISISLWLHPHVYWEGGCKIITHVGSGSTSADNCSWWLNVNASNPNLRFRWEYGTKTSVLAYSADDVVSTSSWTHNWRRLCSNSDWPVC
jgi:hypothetical protein